MTQTSAGALWTIDDYGALSEVFNDERTRFYNFHQHPLWAGSLCDNCGCPALKYDPYSGAPVVFGTDPTSGPSPAPWALTDAYHAGEFLGFMTTDITGLDYAHVERTINQRGTNGAMATPLRLAGREINVTMLATATTEQGMRYGLDWLAQRLAQLGGRCGYGRVLMKLYCPEGTDGVFDQGNVEMREVSLVKGPIYTTNYLAGAGHLVREVQFTLLAGDPCFYTTRMTCLAAQNYTLPQVSLNTICTTPGVTVAGLLCGAIDPHTLPFNVASPVCSVAPDAVLESRAATVTIQMLGGVAGPFMVESWRGDPSDNPSLVIGRDGNGQYLGRIGVNYMSGTQGLQIDAVAGIIWTRQAPWLPWTPDDSLIMFNNQEVPYFPRDSGESGLFVTVRPYYVCSGTGEFQVTIESTSVFSCVV